LKVLSVASECFPFIKTGGLADVVGALPSALDPLGVDMRVLIPRFPAVEDHVASAVPVRSYDDLFGGPARLMVATARDGRPLFLLDAPQHFARAGNPYLNQYGRDWPDNHLRFAALAFAARDLGLDGAAEKEGAAPSWRPDILQAHDWQAGLAPLYLAFSDRRPPPSVLTIHNLAFQGNFPARHLGALGLSTTAFTTEVAEFYGQISFLKAGVTTADRITTVSPTYAAEIRRPELGMGFDGILRARGDAVSGILNGIDTALWDPQADPAIAAPYSAADPAPKAINKRALQERLGLAPEPDRPLFCILSRLTAQKGIDLVLDLIPFILARGGQVVALGSGDANLEAGLRAAANAAPRAVGVVTGYDEPLAHRIQAGADAILVPSRFEPCGLTQLIGLRYGTLPIVARTGGLADTIIDANEMAVRDGCATGFQFRPDSPPHFAAALDAAFRLFANRPAWERAVRRAMSQDVSWNASARSYLSLFRSLLKHDPPTR